MEVARGLWGAGNEETLVEGHKLPVVRRTGSWRLMHSMVATVNNTVLYTSEFLREWTLNVLTTKRTVISGGGVRC